ncbi:MAG: glutamate formimidoyltransferase [Chloroflexota bacterium]
MKAVVECVPNFSEGRNPEVIQQITDAIGSVTGVQVLSASSDESHNRTVVTFAGDPQSVSEAAFRGIAAANELIDLDEHEGEHPRLGAADVVPFIPVSGISIAECAELARRLGKRVGAELAHPVYLYEHAAMMPERRNLADVRRGEYEIWKEQVGVDPDRKPDYGPAEPRKSGATIIGARPFLIAFNAYLSTSDVSVAQKIARSIRHSSGGLRFVKALGLEVDGAAQISMNLTDFGKTPIHQVLELIRVEAAQYGAAVTHTELVGLIPQQALIDSAKWYLGLHDLESDQVLENALKSGEADDPVDAASELLEAVAAGTPTPGGGSVAAVAAALASALGSMVSQLTLNRKRYVEVHADAARLLDELAQLQNQLLDAAKEDSAAYEQVVKAMRYSRLEDADSAKAEEMIEDATRYAGEVPLRTAESAIQVMDILLELAKIGNTYALTDVGVGAQMARAAVESAALNVLVNGSSLKDQVLADIWRAKVEQLRQEAEERLMATMKRVVERGGIG